MKRGSEHADVAAGHRNAQFKKVRGLSEIRQHLQGIDCEDGDDDQIVSREMTSIIGDPLRWNQLGPAPQRISSVLMTPGSSGRQAAGKPNSGEECARERLGK